MLPEIQAYNDLLEPRFKEVGDLLAGEISRTLAGAENRIWHRHPVWFLEGNPIVGYSKQKPGIRLMFWSGASFEEPGLKVIGAKFKDASIFYGHSGEVDLADLRRWLARSLEVQWNYRDVVRNKGRLDRLV